MRKIPRIGCMGELLVELVCTSRNGRHRVASSYLGPFPSGASGIFIDQAAQIGGRCFFVGALGDDAFGDVVRERLVAHGVDVSLVRTARTWPTGSAFVSYNDDGSRDFVFNIARSAAAQFSADAPTLKALEAFGLDALHVSGSALSEPAMVRATGKRFRVVMAMSSGLRNESQQWTTCFPHQNFAVAADQKVFQFTDALIAEPFVKFLRRGVEGRHA